MVNKTKLTIITTLLLIITIQGAMAEDMGIYTIDYMDILEDDEITEINIGESAITHMRDNYYGILYNDLTNKKLKLRIIEMENNPLVLNSTELYIKNNKVDELEILSGNTINGATRGQLQLINFNTTTGATLLVYIGRDDYYKRLRTVTLYENGTINQVNFFINTYLNYHNIHTIKTSEKTFITAAQSGQTSYKLFGGTVEGNGALTMSNPASGYWKTQTGTTLSWGEELQLIKHGNECRIYFKRNTGTLLTQSTPFSCSGSSTEYGGTYNNRPSRTLIEIEGNIITDLNVEYNEYNDRIYIAFSETIDRYPTLQIRKTDNTLLNKERLLNNTSTKDFTMILGEQGNTVMSYTKQNNVLNLMTYIVESNGNIKQGYITDEYLYGYRAQLYKIEGLENNYILSNQYDDGINTYGTITTLGIGVLPPPNPADTSVSILDERTLEPYNMDNKTITFYAHCVDNINFQETITSTSQGINVNCNYESFSIQVQSEITPDLVYTRKYLRNLQGQNQFNLDVYLIDPHTTTYIDNEIQIDDMTGTYTNPKLYFNKNINGETTQITASGLDLTNSMRAVLMHDQEYYVYLESDETGLNYLGKYQSPSTSEGFYKKSVINLFDIKLTPNINRILKLVEYQFEVDEDDLTVTYFTKTPDGGNPSIINLDVKIYNGSIKTGTLIYDEFHGLENYNYNTLYTFLSGTVDLSAYENNTLNAKMTIAFVDKGEIRYLPYETTIWIKEKLTLPIEKHLPQGALDWFLVILLGTIALFATVKSANIAAIGIIGLASLFVLFGWFSLGAGALGLAALVSFVNLISSNKREVELQ